MHTVFVTPRLLDDGEAALVRMPERGYAPLPIEGRDVPLDEYWSRRLRDGDVIEGGPPADAPEAPAPKAAPSVSQEP
ncbi:DUF2635 domain-containing protein [Methylobacterium organophilum]|uniref:DUF2635 domain-containing protein n=1 Tax=Methylobacterium organophilum TaxID=410 RepID=A0ABQ4TAP3_METOR|nr:DUF2635 domain-containing protein [Methylobacterium organophilum]UMY19132.1 DUF2635 domain-containing protein [Methylobacterium organophilum]GJE27950.1 hypothetical protein LKMONMHP_2812 [Methylobacterium organophilum]